MSFYLNNPELGGPCSPRIVYNDIELQANEPESLERVIERLKAVEVRLIGRMNEAEAKRYNKPGPGLYVYVKDAGGGEHLSVYIDAFPPA